MTSYGVILCDPPWSYSNNKTGGERKNQKAKGGCLKHFAKTLKHLLRIYTESIKVYGIQFPFMLISPSG